MADFDAALPVRQDSATSPWIVNLADVAGAATDVGNGAAGTGTQRVAIASDNSPLAVSQNGTWNINNISGTVSLPTGAATSALQTSGNSSLSTIASNTTGLALDATVAQLNVAQGASLGTNTGPMVQGSVTTAAPTYTTGTVEPLSLTTAGAVRVDGSGVTQPISATALPLPAGAATSALQTTGNSSLSSIDGKLATLGQKTMAGSMPVTLASDQGAILVDISGQADKVNVFNFNTGSTVAVNAVSTHTYTPAANAKVTYIQASASGQMKVEVKYGTTGSEATIAVFFTSKSNQNVIWPLQDNLLVTPTQSILVLRKNMDNQAMDVYSTVEGFVA